jgi:hypothetical protein
MPLLEQQEAEVLVNEIIIDPSKSLEDQRLNLDKVPAKVQEETLKTLRSSRTGPLATDACGPG